jgi:hypothetical protein
LSRPNLFTLDTWGRHENLVLEMFQCALLRLEAESELPEKEDELNRKLLFHVRSENHRLTREGRGCASPPFYESRNQPVAENEDSPTREFKRPDFTWGFVDALAEVDYFFVIECKRLGRPSAGGSVFNKLYTVEGVKRFVELESGYGAGVESGAMVGYCQTMSGDDILKEVNCYGRSVAVPSIHRAADKWIDRGVTRLNQTLDRKASPSPFSLRHLWVDLRHRYATEASVKSGALNGN